MVTAGKSICVKIVIVRFPFVKLRFQDMFNVSNLFYSHAIILIVLEQKIYFLSISQFLTCFLTIKLLFENGFRAEPPTLFN